MRDPLESARAHRRHGLVRGRPQAGERRTAFTVARASADDGGLPLTDSSVDVVIMSELIEHLVDPDGTLDEAWRVLRPGGTLLLSTPNLAAWYNRVLLRFGIQPLFTEVSFAASTVGPGTRWWGICGCSPDGLSRACSRPWGLSPLRSRAPPITMFRIRLSRSTDSCVARRAWRRTSWRRHESLAESRLDGLTWIRGVTTR